MPSEVAPLSTRLAVQLGWRLGISHSTSSQHSTEGRKVGSVMERQINNETELLMHGGLYREGKFWAEGLECNRVVNHMSLRHLKRSMWARRYPFRLPNSRAR